MSLRRKIVFAFIPSIVLLLVLEIGARLFFASDDVRRAFLGTTVFDEDYVRRAHFRTRSLMIPDPYCLFRLRENDEPGDKRPPKLPPSPRRPGEVRILALGDSTTYGYRIDYQYSWPKQVEDALNDWLPGSRSVRVFNGGVPAYGPQQAKRIMQSRYMGIEPDIILWREEPTFSDAVELPVVDPKWRSGRIPLRCHSQLLYLLAVLRDLAHFQGDVADHLVNLPAQEGDAYVPDVLPRFVAWCRAKGVKGFVAVEYLTYDASRPGSCKVEGNAADWSGKGLPLIEDREAFCAEGVDPERMFIDRMHFSEEGAALQGAVVAAYLKAHWDEILAGTNSPAN